MGQCEICFNLATEATCRICQDERRETATLCVVEQPSDVIPIERSGEFQGRYHVLGGPAVDRPSDAAPSTALASAAAAAARRTTGKNGHTEVK